MVIRSIDQTKFCKLCGEERPILEFYFITRGDKKVPSPYCKTHMKAKAKEGHQRRRWRAMMTPEELARAKSLVCASCGKNARNQPVVQPPENFKSFTGWRLCVDCRNAVEEFGWSHAKALAMWLQLRGHIKAVEKAQSEWRANRAPHDGYWHQIVEESPPWPHVMCEPKEILWRRVMEFLKVVKPFVA